MSFSMKQAVPPICGVEELPMIERFFNAEIPPKITTSLENVSIN